MQQRATPRRRLAAEPRPSHPSRVRLHSEFARPPPTQRLNQNSNWTCPLRMLRARATLVSCRDHTPSSNLPFLRCFYLRPNPSRSKGTRPFRFLARCGSVIVDTRKSTFCRQLYGDASRDNNQIHISNLQALLTCDQSLSPNAQSRSSILITEPRVDLSNRQRSTKSSSSPRSAWWEMKRVKSTWPQA